MLLSKSFQIVSVLTRPPEPAPPPAPPAPEPEPPEPVSESSGLSTFNSSIARRLVFIFFVLSAALPVLSARSSAELAASDQSSATPPPDTSNFQPKIAPRAFVTIVAKLITFCITKFRVRKNGLNALISAPPIMPPNCWKFCFKIRT